MVYVDLKGCRGFWPEEAKEALIPELTRAADLLQNGGGEGSDFLGWVTLPTDYDREEFDRILQAAEQIRAQSQALVVIGIGGSYLGARGVTEFLLPQVGKQALPIYFAGNNLNSDAMYAVMEKLEGIDWSINVISKSGTTTEPAVAFRFFKALLEEKYGAAEAQKRIYVTTDKARGALFQMAKDAGYPRFVVPDNIGGRYSVLTAVGLLPIAAFGADIRALMEGAEEMQQICRKNDFTNPAWCYAAARMLLYRSGKKIDVLSCFEPSFHYLGEWWKQLYAESEGKNHLGLFPASLEMTADLHSFGQYLQDGERTLLETVLRFDRPIHTMTISAAEDNGDGLNYLAGLTLDELQRRAMDGTLLAHVDGGVPNIIIRCEDKKEKVLGGLLYFFEYACGLSGYLMGVNPFNQPGVEDYKRNMFALCGKPGYEQLGEKLRSQLV